MEINHTGATTSVIPPSFVPAYSAWVSVPSQPGGQSPAGTASCGRVPGWRALETGVGAGSCLDALPGLPGHTARNAGRKPAIKTEQQRPPPRLAESPSPSPGTAKAPGRPPAPHPARPSPAPRPPTPRPPPSRWARGSRCRSPSRPPGPLLSRAGREGKAPCGAALPGAGPASPHGARAPPARLPSALPPLFPASLPACPRLPAGGGFRAGPGPGQPGLSSGSRCWLAIALRVVLCVGKW